MYTTTHIDPKKPPRATRFLNMRVLCGHCRFKCCNSPSLKVECTPAEAKKLQLPILFEQNGHCRCLTPAGCVHGPHRPVFCKLFPLQVTPDNKLIVSHWAILNCPMGHDYNRVGASTPPFAPNGDDYDYGAFLYERNPVSGAKQNNSQKLLSMPGNKPLEQFPTVLETCKEALVELYGEEGYQTIVKDLKRLNKTNPGFGLK